MESTQKTLDRSTNGALHCHKRCMSGLPTFLPVKTDVKSPRFSTGHEEPESDVEDYYVYESESENESMDSDAEEATNDSGPVLRKCNNLECTKSVSSAFINLEGKRSDYSHREIHQYFDENVRSLMDCAVLGGFDYSRCRAVLDGLGGDLRNIYDLIMNTPEETIQAVARKISTFSIITIPSQEQSTRCFDRFCNEDDGCVMNEGCGHSLHPECWLPMVRHQARKVLEDEQWPALICLATDTCNCVLSDKVLAAVRTLDKSINLDAVRLRISIKSYWTTCCLQECPSNTCNQIHVVRKEKFRLKDDPERFVTMYDDILCNLQRFCGNPNCHRPSHAPASCEAVENFERVRAEIIAAERTVLELGQALKQAENTLQVAELRLTNFHHRAAEILENRHRVLRENRHRHHPNLPVEGDVEIGTLFDGLDIEPRTTTEDNRVDVVAPLALDDAWLVPEVPDTLQHQQVAAQVVFEQRRNPWASDDNYVDVEPDFVGDAEENSVEDSYVPHEAILPEVPVLDSDGSSKLPAVELPVQEQNGSRLGLSAVRRRGPREAVGSIRHYNPYEHEGGIVKVCPNPACDAHIQKMGGCDHMTCTRCGTEFSWTSLAIQQRFCDPMMMYGMEDAHAPMMIYEMEDARAPLRAQNDVEEARRRVTAAENLLVEATDRLITLKQGAPLDNYQHHDNAVIGADLSTMSESYSTDAFSKLYWSRRFLKFLLVLQWYNRTEIKQEVYDRITTKIDTLSYLVDELEASLARSVRDDEDLIQMRLVQRLRIELVMTNSRLKEWIPREHRGFCELSLVNRDYPF